MKILLNGDHRELADGATVAVAVQTVGFDTAARRGIAVAVNGSVAHHSSWSSSVLREGDVVEILTAVQGG
jgi:sulfur carrier protein